MREDLVREFHVWFVWNHEREQTRLDALSRKGLHLVKPGVLSCTYRKDPHVQYVYRLDYQPKVYGRQDMQEYLGIFSDAGWEHVGSCKRWHYFRQVATEGKLQEIYTDKDSLRQLYRRIRNVLAIGLVLELCILAFEALLALFTHQPWSLSAAEDILLLAVIALLAYGCTKFHRRLRH